VFGRHFLHRQDGGLQRVELLDHLRQHGRLADHQVVGQQHGEGLTPHQAFAAQHGVAAGERLVEVQQIVEKPAPEKAPSRLGVAGRYILTPAVFDQIRQQPRGVGNEIQLTDGIAGLLRSEKVFAYQYVGKRYDCGSKEGFLEANVELALRHPQIGAGFRAYLKALDLG